MKTRSSGLGTAGFLYVFTGGGMKYFGPVKIDKHGYAYTAANPEGVPIEDFGDYIVLSKKISENEAYKKFIRDL